MHRGASIHTDSHLICLHLIFTESNTNRKSVVLSSGLREWEITLICECWRSLVLSGALNVCLPLGSDHILLCAANLLLVNSDLRMSAGSEVSAGSQGQFTSGLVLSRSPTAQSHYSLPLLLKPPSYAQPVCRIHGLESILVCELHRVGLVTVSSPVQCI